MIIWLLPLRFTSLIFPMWHTGHDDSELSSTKKGSFEEQDSSSSRRSSDSSILTRVDKYPSMSVELLYLSYLEGGEWRRPLLLSKCCRRCLYSKMLGIYCCWHFQHRAPGVAIFEFLFDSTLYVINIRKCSFYYFKHHFHFHLTLGLLFIIWLALI